VAKLGERVVGSVGEYLAEQRKQAKLSLRQLSDIAGVSNPYLSQIERGLRKPSAEVLQQLAKALRISAETLYVRAGILDPDDERTGRDTDRGVTVADAILLDPALNERQKRVLLDVYSSFVKENEATTSPSRPVATSAPKKAVKKPRSTAKPAAENTDTSQGA